MLLHSEGMTSEDVKWIIKEDMDSIMRSFMEGKSEMALLREPFVTWAVSRGSRIFLDDSMRSLGVSVLLFSREFMEKKPEVVKKFLFGYEQSVLALNYQPDWYRPLLIDKGGLPQEIKKKYPMPIFEGAGAPSESEVAPVVQWLVKKNFISKSIPYKELVTLNFLPNPENVGLAFCCR
jgi:NitT/TauT family transport system substrate-binding protein